MHRPYGAYREIPRDCSCASRKRYQIGGQEGIRRPSYRPHKHRRRRFGYGDRYSGVTFDYIRIHKYGYIAWGCETKIDVRLADQTLFEPFGPDENDIKEAIILEDWEQGINRRNQE